MAVIVTGVPFFFINRVDPYPFNLPIPPGALMSKVPVVISISGMAVFPGIIISVSAMAVLVMSGVALGVLRS